MNAELISIGDELLIGQVINTNASWIAAELYDSGINVSKITTISDNYASIINTLDSSIENSEIIIITGGLGPTNDDITKKTLSDYFKVPLVFDNDTYKRIETFFKQRGLGVTELNRKQAEVLDGCLVIPNFSGTASGMWFEYNGKIIISLPGVPFEMKAMMKDFVIPEIKKKIKIKNLKKTVLVCGIGESFLAEKIKDWENNLPENIKLAYLPQPGIIRLRLSITGSKNDNIESYVLSEVEKLKKIIPEYIFGYDDETLAENVANMLINNRKTLSIAESCTGGYLSHMFTSIPGSSKHFKGGIVAYSNEIKMKFLDVSPETLSKNGAVSEQTVIEMAKGSLKKFETDFSIAVSGIAGPDGGSDEKPVGTIWVAVADKNKVITEKFLHGEDRGRNIIKASISAINILRKLLIENC
jgi:nicotinamide-nucleotide amidase